MEGTSQMIREELLTAALSAVCEKTAQMLRCTADRESQRVMISEAQALGDEITRLTPSRLESSKQDTPTT